MLNVVVGHTRITLDAAHEQQQVREAQTGDDQIAAEEQLDQTLRETLLSRDSEALLSPFAASSADVDQMKAARWIRRVKDMSVYPPEGELKTMYAVVLHYFTHREEKAATPSGKGALQRRHIDVAGVDVIGVESNKLAQAGAEDTAEVLGGREQLGSRRYGTTGHMGTSGSDGTRRPCGRRLASLFGETMPDLLAASCLSRKTLERLAHTTYEPSPETRAALEQAMHLLDPDHPESIAGWHEMLRPEQLAHLLDMTLDNVQARFRGKTTWTAGERSKLVRFMTVRRAAIAQRAQLDNAE